VNLSEAITRQQKGELAVIKRGEITRSAAQSLNEGMFQIAMSMASGWRGMWELRIRWMSKIPSREVER
jgi:hypothetical protein